MSAPENKPSTRIVRDPGICLSLPVYGKADVPFVQCMMNLLATSTSVTQVDFLQGDSLVNRARNNLAHRFMKGFPGHDEQGPMTTQHDWLLFIDTDLIFAPEDVDLLYALGREKGPGVYVGTYPIKQLKPKVVMNAIPGKKIEADGTIEVREAGTGFMLIHREVFARMAKHFEHEIRYEADAGNAHDAREIMNDFFSVGVRLDPDLGWKRFLSEDWYFCQRWREMGGKILMQTRISCQHIGTFAYPGDPKDVIAAGEHYKAALERIQAARAKSAPRPVSVKTVEQPA